MNQSNELDLTRVVHSDVRKIAVPKIEITVELLHINMS